MTVPAIIATHSVTVLIGGKTLVARSDHPNFEAIKTALKNNAAPTTIAGLFDIVKAIETKAKGRVQIQGNTVLYDGKPLHNTLTTRMVAMLAEGFNIDPLINFLEKLMENPSHRAVNGLYDFLAATNIPITPEGNFLAYKKVRSTYFDIHSNTMRNAPGDVLSVPRNAVDEDPDRTCSHGLHVCSESYLSQFGSSGGNDRVVIVEVNPKDVVAIPRDYNNAKMRCAGYKVVGEVDPKATATAFTSTVVSGADFKPGEAKPATPAAAIGTLSFKENDVIKNIAGTPVRFVYDDEAEMWTATWTDGDGEEQEADYYEVSLDEAVEEFEDEHTEEAVDYTAEVRWLDEDAELQIETVTLTVPDEEGEPCEYEFVDKLAESRDDVDEDGARVVNVTRVADSKRRRISVW